MKNKTEEHDKITLKLIKTNLFNAIHQHTVKKSIPEEIDWQSGNKEIYPEYALNYGYSIDLLVKQTINCSKERRYSGIYATIYEIKPIRSITSISQVIRQVNQYEKLLTNVRKPCFKVIVSDDDCKPEWEVLLKIAEIKFYNIHKIE